MHVGLALRRLRLESGSSLRNLARRAGVSSAYLSRLEHGLDAEPTPERLRLFAQEFGVPPALLLELGHRLGPWVGRYVEQSPAAAALFLALAQRELDDTQLNEVRHFVEERWPLDANRVNAPSLIELLSPTRLVLGLRGATLPDALTLAAGRLSSVAPELSAAHLSGMLMGHHQRIGSGVGGGVLAPVARWAHATPAAALIVADEPLAVETPDHAAPRVIVALGLAERDPRGLAYIAQVARLAARGLSEALARVHDPEDALDAIRALETP